MKEDPTVDQSESPIFDYSKNEESLRKFFEMKRSATAITNDPQTVCDERKAIQLSPLRPIESTHDPAHPNHPFMRGYLRGHGVHFWSGNVGSLDSQHRDDRFLLGGRPSRLDETKINDWYDDVEFRSSAYITFHTRNFQKPQDFQITAKGRSQNSPSTYAQLFIGKQQQAFHKIPGGGVPFEISATIINLVGNADIPITVRLASKRTHGASFFFEGITISMI